jgi:UDP-N-acetylglucosamine acyltransferase
VGEGAIVGGHASMSFDIPPHVMVADRNRLAGLNLIGLRRRGVPRETIAELKRLFHEVYAGSNPKRAAAAALAAGRATTVEGRRFLEFFGAGKRGIVRPRSGGQPAEEPDEFAT